MNTVNSIFFRENCIFANSIKSHICHVRNSRLGQELPTSVNDRVISPFREGLFSRNFASAKVREIKILAKISEFTVTNALIRLRACNKVRFSRVKAQIIELFLHQRQHRHTQNIHQWVWQLQHSSCIYFYSLIIFSTVISYDVIFHYTRCKCRVTSIRLIFISTCIIPLFHTFPVVAYYFNP